MGQNERKVVGSFGIPDELAKELSDLLVKQTIRDRLMYQFIEQGNTAKAAEVEKMIIPITSKIEAIKIRITNEFVPKEYNSQRYMWNYNGYEISGNKVDVIEA